MADSTFFGFFDQTWLYARPEDILNKPYSIVLTDELARTIFGKINPVGMTHKSSPGGAVLILTLPPVVATGIMKDLQ